jgi:hypothetical protein
MVNLITSDTSGSYYGCFVTLGGINNYVPVFFTMPIGSSLSSTKTVISELQLAHLFNTSSSYILVDLVAPLLILIER